MAIISIHVLLAGDDWMKRVMPAASLRFLSTSPLAGDDPTALCLASWTANFYPRPPCGGRHNENQHDDNRTQFLSTSPLRGTTRRRFARHRHVADFYPRPPCGGRRVYTRYNRRICHFYPRPPCGGRPKLCQNNNTIQNFYPRPPCGGRLRVGVGCFYQSAISIHVPLAGDDH